MYYEFNHRNHTEKNTANDDDTAYIPSTPTDEQWSSYFDQDENEQIRQMTIHGNIHEISSISYQISLIDTPGYKEYMKNFIRYISQSDVVLLVFSANDLIEKVAHIPSTPNADRLAFDGYFELLDKLRICHLFEINQMIIVINKMEKFNYSKSKFIECCNEIEKLLKMVGYRYKNKIAMIPISALKGDNILKKSCHRRLKWWNGYKLECHHMHRFGYNTVYTIYDAIELINYNEIKIYNKNIINIKPFKMSICNIYEETLNGEILSGRIENGKISIGTTIKCFPSGCCGEIKSIEMFNKKCLNAQYGDIIGISLDSFLLHPQRGDILLNDKNIKQYEICKFEAIIDVQKHLIKKKYKKATWNHKLRCFRNGFSPIIYTNNAIKQCQCQMIDILWKINKNIKPNQLNVFPETGNHGNNGNKFQQKIKTAQYLEPGDTAKILFEPNRQFAISLQQKIVILEHKELIMTGKVTKLHYTDEVMEDLK